MKLQEIRARQVLEEEGLNLPIKIIHSNNPKTIIGNKEFSLIFPKFMFNYHRPKNTSLIFIGKKTKSREEFLKKFNAKIIYTDRGRNPKIKSKDEFYFNELSSAFFVLCPNGDYIWTYRFFEAIIFRAIPIVEMSCQLYDGYNFYRHGDTYDYHEDLVDQNINKLKMEMTWI